MAELISAPPLTRVLYEALTADVLQRPEYSAVRFTGIIPPKRPATFGRVLVAGGTTGSLVTTIPTYVVESYAPSETEAEALALYVDALIHRYGRVGWVGETPCRSAEAFSLPGSLPDPVTSKPRWTATYAIELRSLVLP